MLVRDFIMCFYYIMKSIITVNGTLEAGRTITSNWVSVDDYTGARVNCKTSHLVLVSIEGSVDGFDVDHTETYRMSSSSVNTTEIDVKFDFCRIVIQTLTETSIMVKGYIYNKVGKSKKCINYTGTFNVEEFQTLNLTLRNATAFTTPVTASIKTTFLNSQSGAIKKPEVLSLQTISPTVANRPLSEKDDTGGYFFMDGIQTTYAARPYKIGSDFAWGSNVKGLQGSAVANPLTIGIDTSKHIQGIQYDKFQDVPIYNSIVNARVPQLNFNYDTNLSVENDTNLQNMMNKIVHSSTGWTIYAFFEQADGYFLRLSFQDGTYLSCRSFESKNQIGWGANESNDTSVGLLYLVDLLSPVSVAISKSTNGTFRLYINGIIADTSTNSSQISVYSNMFPEFIGKLINYRFYSEVLTDADISELHDYDNSIIKSIVANKIIDISGYTQITIEATINEQDTDTAVDEGYIEIEGLLF